MLFRGHEVPIGQAALAGLITHCSTPMNTCCTQVHNENGSKRVVVTKDLPGTRWLDVLLAANCRVEICAHEDFILSQTTIKTLMSEGMRQCHGVIGQLTEVLCPSILSSCVVLQWFTRLFGSPHWSLAAFYMHTCAEGCFSLR